jgi:hypothetical protein
MDAVIRRRTACWTSIAALVAVAALPAAQTRPASSFAQTIARLSERGGYFDTDNLISNESSYLQVLPELSRRSRPGGVYIGVGPDQNFTYISATRPSIAFIVDIRRDNELLHLLFKALFRQSRTRVEYLSLLCGRIVPADVEAWRSASVDRIAKYVDEAGRAEGAALRARMDRAMRETGVPLTVDDMKTIAGFHQRFIDAGLGLRFESAGRPPQWNYPSYRDLLVDTDAGGRQSNYLASEDAFQFVKGLEARDLVIPVVGDLAGPSALGAIGKLLGERGERLATFYASNVEFYLYREGTLPRFIANLRQIPRRDNAVIIRSTFGRVVAGARPTDDSVSRLQPLAELLSSAEGRVRPPLDRAARNAARASIPLARRYSTIEKISR